MRCGLVFEKVFWLWEEILYLILFLYSCVLYINRRFSWFIELFFFLVFGDVFVMDYLVVFDSVIIVILLLGKGWVGMSVIYFKKGKYGCNLRYRDGIIFVSWLGSKCFKNMRNVFWGYWMGEELDRWYKERVE